MSAPLKTETDLQTAVFSRMTASDIEAVVAIERHAYPFPWTRGNFLDSLESGYEAWVLRDCERRLLAYFLLMYAVEEVHLLNITVRPDRQGQGIGRILLDKVMTLARDAGMHAVLLDSAQYSDLVK